jgi:hypothetical protein
MGKSSGKIADGKKEIVMGKVMKSVCFMMLGLLLVGCANLTVVPTEERQLQNVTEINLSKNEIFDKTLEWMAQSFTDSKAVIELKDKENGKIIGKGMTSFTNVVANIPCRFTMIVEIKDNKYRTTYNNFVGMWTGAGSLEVKEEGFINEVKVNLNLLDKSLYSYLKNSKSSSNW